MDIAGRWMEGETVTQICQEYGMFEGNLLRGLLKINTILTEWTNLASFCEHPEVLDRLRDTPQQLLKDIAVSESLYVK
jgi:hypothetical protein